MKHETEKLVNWASILEENTLEQAKTTAGMSFIYPHLALMPDAHLGKGATVGSVIPTDRAIIPAAVGVDIGCGMIAVQTQWTEEDLRADGDMADLRETIERSVPLSAGKYNTSLTDSAEVRIADLESMWEDTCAEFGSTPEDYAQNWKLQLGSLGSGNHFIEIVADEDSRVWAFLHSGSRGVGNKIAQRHIKVAQQVMDRYHIDVPEKDLAYLAEDTPEFDHYMAELHWAQEFALQNRAEMMTRTLGALAAHMDEDVVPGVEVSCHHNYTSREHHFHRNLWVSRKGAISAKEGELGLIPGSMGTASYVVRGLGNKMSFHSAPHGAGRTFSRSKARKTFTIDELRTAMAGIEYRDTEAFLDEIPAAYKDVDQVMQDAADLVEVVHKFHQIVNVKGD